MKYTPKGCFELRACRVCGQRVAHRLVDGEPHARHLLGVRHLRALKPLIEAHVMARVDELWSSRPPGIRRRPKTAEEAAAFIERVQAFIGARA